MKLRHLVLAAGLAVTSAAVVGPVAADPAHGARLVSVSVDDARPVQTSSPFARLAVSQPWIAEAIATADGQFSVRGKAVGSTPVLMYDADGRLVDVVTIDVQPALTGGLEPAAPAPPRTGPRQVSVTLDHSTPIQSPAAFKRISVSQPDIADVTPTSDNRFFVRGKQVGATNVLIHDAEGRLVDVLDIRVEHDLGAVRADLDLLFPGADVQLSRVANKIHVRGAVDDAPTARRIMEIATSYAPDNVINDLKVVKPQQVMLEVRFIEASRQAIKDIGFGSEIGRPGDFLFSTASNLVSGLPGKTAGALLGGSGSVQLDVFLNALEEKGVIEMLAEPNLVARSGETASFLAGGEFPVPVAAEDGEVTIEFRQFGVSLAFTPTVLSGDEISLKVVPEVSQLDVRNSIRLAGVEIPALRVRKADTTIDLRDGQSFAVAGLIQSDYDNSVAQTPLAGEMPVLGALFRSTRFRKNETELVIVITPRLVKPAPSKAELNTILRQVGRPGEAELFFLGLVNRNGQDAVGQDVSGNIDTQSVRDPSQPNSRTDLELNAAPLVDGVSRYQDGEVYAPVQLRTSPVDTDGE